MIRTGFWLKHNTRFILLSFQSAIGWNRALQLVSCAVLCLIMVSCAESQISPERVFYTKASFSDLEGFQEDHLAGARTALLNSCDDILRKPSTMSLQNAGTPADWKEPCQAIQEAVTENELRHALQEQFTVYELSSSLEGNGLFTGYYEVQFKASRTKSNKYRYPIYGRPRDLVSVDLGTFHRELAGQTILGQLKDHRLVPYDDRAHIELGSLKHRAQPILYLEDPIDAFFLSIQGSGEAELPTRKTVHVGFECTNGQPYVAIGRKMLESGLIDQPVSMQKIKSWLSLHPKEAPAIMNQNPSYVFYHLDTHAYSFGSEQVPLTPLRSLAVDTHFVSLGVPLWLETFDPDGVPFNHLMIAQDTGGAIKGSVRGDIFFGRGPDAASKAGRMQSKGRYFALIPKTVVPSSP